VITGGAVRIGRAISRALVEAGCEVFVHYGRSVEPAKKLKQEVEDLGGRIEIFAADLERADEVAAIFPAALAAFGKIDFLINSAAIYQEGGLDNTSVEMWDREFAINLRAPFILSQAYARQFTAGTGGHIVNIVDARLNRPGADHFAYRLTKGGLRDLTKNLALELAPRIQVNALALGAILPPPGQDQAYLDRLATARVPLCRGGSAELVADNVLHLLGSPFTTGAILPLDGGEFL
jgi:glucose 1-dehydrogenase